MAELSEIKKELLKGRGARENPSGRFEKFQTDLSDDERELHPFRTEIFKDASKSIISTNDSPDIGMEATLNPYRGCEHGCIYCYARPGHEYLGLSAGIDFESKIFVKENAAELLRRKLEAKSWVPKVVTLSGVTDCYQPLEKKLLVTRRCIEVLKEFRNPFAIITKNYLVTRDIDLLAEMARYRAASVSVSITTLDRILCRKMEPRASTPELRLKAIEGLSRAGIPVHVMLGPVLPGLTDHEIPEILKRASEAGAVSAYYTMLRLPYGVKDLFQTWIKEHYPDKADKVLNRVRDVRGGKLYDAEFGTRMTGKGIYADQIAQIFDLYRKKYGLMRRVELSTAHFKKPVEAQGSFFDF